MNNEPNIFQIPEENNERFLAEIARLSKRAIKIGCPAIVPNFIEYKTLKGRNAAGFLYNYRVLRYTISNPAPKIAGWQFIATIDHTNETGNIIRTVPNTGIEMPTEFRNAAATCDHCHVNRRRNTTFVLHNNETKKFLRVGRQCIRDYFGHDAEHLARYAEMLGFASECGHGDEDDFGGATRRYFYTLDYLAHAAAMIRLHGWISKAAANADMSKIPTAESALTNMFPYSQKEKAEAVQPTEEDRKTAGEAIEWGIGLLDKATLSDYEHNVTVVAGSSVIQRKALGIAASVVGVYLMNRDRQAVRAAENAAKAPSQHVGKEGERLKDMPAKVIVAKTIEGQFGVTILYSFVSGGNVFKWFATSHQDIRVGDMVELTGTVKKHTTFQGVKETMLTRCKIKVKQDA